MKEESNLDSGFNVDVKVTVEKDPSKTQYINMTIASTGGEFDWDGRQRVAFVFDGPSSSARLVLAVQEFSGPQGGLPRRGAKGGGVLADPDNPQLLGDIKWEIA